MIVRRTVFCFVLGLCQAMASSAVIAKEVVLSVAQDGKLNKNGIPYRGVGVNYFDAFYRTLFSERDQSYKRGFEELGKYQIPFARIMLTGYWPRHLKLYMDNPADYFSRMDGVIAAAAENNIGIVASLNWNPSTIPDLVGEPLSAWGNKDSKTVTFMRKYTSDVVRRYKNNDAIWMWEFGNEYTLLADLPPLAARMNRPAVDVSKGTPHTRTDQDDLKFDDVRVAFDVFIETVRALDSSRIVSTGNSLPRPFAYHNSFMRNWALDTKAQFCHVLKRDNPSVFNVTSIHVYLKHESKNYFSDDGNHIADIVREAKKCSKQTGQPLFVGEFGYEFDEVDGDYEKTYVRILDDVIRGGADLSAIWVYDFKHQQKCCSFGYENDKSYVLKLLRDANGLLR